MLIELSYIKPDGEVKNQKILSLDYTTFCKLRHFVLEIQNLSTNVNGKIRIKEVEPDVR